MHRVGRKRGFFYTTDTIGSSVVDVKVDNGTPNQVLVGQISPNNNQDQIV